MIFQKKKEKIYKISEFIYNNRHIVVLNNTPTSNPHSLCNKNIYSLHSPAGGILELAADDCLHIQYNSPEIHPDRIQAPSARQDGGMELGWQVHQIRLFCCFSFEMNWGLVISLIKRRVAVGLHAADIYKYRYRYINIKNIYIFIY